MVSLSSSSSSAICRSSSNNSCAFHNNNHHHHHQQRVLQRISPKQLHLQLGAADNKVSSFSPVRRPYIANLLATKDGAANTTVTPIEEKDIPFKKLNDACLSITPPEESKHLTPFDLNKDKSSVSITVVGASGDLAKKKIFPALFALYYEDCLPEHFTIFGYARSKMTDAELRDMVSRRTLTCRIDKRENCSEKMEQFLKRCFYHSGQHDSKKILRSSTKN